MKRLDQRGETLVEVVMALGVLSLVLVSSYALATGTFRMGRGAGERTQAVNYLQQQAEALRTYRDANNQDWSVVFVPTINGLISNEGKFCMRPPTDQDADRTWVPVASTNSACTVEGIKVEISSLTTGAAPEIYDFAFMATWDEGNKVNLNTKLTRQGQ